MEHSLTKVLVGAVWLTGLLVIFISQARSDTSNTWESPPITVDKEIISETGLDIWVVQNLVTPDKYIVDSWRFEAICFDLDDDTNLYTGEINGGIDVGSVREDGVAAATFKCGYILSTCFDTKSLYGFYRLQRLYEIQTAVKSVNFNNSRVMKVEKISFETSDSENHPQKFDSSRITITTYFEYEDWSKELLVEGKVITAELGYKKTGRQGLGDTILEINKKYRSNY